MLGTLELFFRTAVGCNAYLTPPGRQGFAPHSDDIDAFILQLEGSKRWDLFPLHELCRAPRILLCCGNTEAAEQKQGFAPALRRHRRLHPAVGGSLTLLSAEADFDMRIAGGPDPQQL